jgi:hypothetical protein
MSNQAPHARFEKKEKKRLIREVEDPYIWAPYASYRIERLDEEETRFTNTIILAVMFQQLP